MSTIGRRPGRSGFDVAAILALPLLLFVVFALPRSVRLEYVLSYGEPTISTVYAMHFVHLDVGHLLTNVGTYVLVVPLTYVFAVEAGRRTWFRVSFVTIVLVFPFVLSGLNLLFPRPRIGYGSSGLLMAFVGLLSLLFFEYLRARSTAFFDRDRAPAPFFGGLGVIALVTLPSSSVRTGVVIASLSIAALYLRKRPSDPPIGSTVRSLVDGSRAQLVVVGFVLVAVLPLAAFPADPIQRGVVVNLYSHLLGYSLGFIAPYATFRLTGVVDARGRHGYPGGSR